MQKENIVHKNLITPEEESIVHKNLITPEEENIYYWNLVNNNVIQKKNYPLSLVPTEEETTSNNTQQNIPQEESFVKPNLNNIALSKSLPNGYGPLNINISYNSQNSTNTLKEGMNQYGLNNYDDKDNINRDRNNLNKNLGTIGGNNDLSRVYNNSDWIYGSQAWTNDPDYYIPTKNCPSLIKNLEQNKDVCPLEINTPWSQWKTGDSEPEPFNL